MFSRNRSRVVVAIATLGVAMLTAQTFAKSAGSARAQSGTELVQAIQAEFAKNSDLRTITVEMAGAVVRLAGEVPSIHAQNQAIDIARRTGGVNSVVNDMTIPAAESDQAIAEGVVKALQSYPHITIWDHVDGVVNDGVVTLVGMVTPDRNKPRDIGIEVAKIPGVQQIRVNIEVMSPAASDEQIRSRIARRLISRGDPFERFESMINPPIRILVNRGIVVLLGYLGFQGDKIELQRIVAQTQGVLRVENHVVVTN